MIVESVSEYEVTALEPCENVGLARLHEVGFVVVRVLVQTITPVIECLAFGRVEGPGTTRRQPNVGRGIGDPIHELRCNRALEPQNDA